VFVNIKEGDIMRLIPIDMKYSKDYLDLWSNFEVIKYTNKEQLNTQRECDEMMNQWINEFTDKDIPNNFVIEADSKIIGICGYPIISKEKFECGLYYQIKQEYWGRGYATEAVRKLISEITNNYSNGIVRADAVIDNLASVKILKNVGFVKTKIEEKGFKKNGLELDIIHFMKEI